MADGQEIPERFQDEEVQLGSRENALISDDSTTREWIRVENEEENDDLYWFDMKEISWERKTDILDESLQTNKRTGEIELDLKDFYRNMMEEVIVDMSVDAPVPVFLKGMRPEVGDQLQDRVPQPGTVMDEMEEGN
jgi:hypothetical protein